MPAGFDFYQHRNVDCSSAIFVDSQDDHEIGTTQVG